jgi:hypothetical protein
VCGALKCQAFVSPLPHTPSPPHTI